MRPCVQLLRLESGCFNRLAIKITITKSQMDFYLFLSSISRKIRVNILTIPNTSLNMEPFPSELYFKSSILLLREAQVIIHESRVFANSSLSYLAAHKGITL